jgi:hypothetical protein
MIDLSPLQDLSADLLKNRVAIARKDVAQFSAVGPATFARLVELAMAGDIAGAEQIIRESSAVWLDFADERGIWNDPYRDERENLRIFAKRNELPESFQKLMGVSAGTASEYPKAFRTKYLGEAP